MIPSNAPFGSFPSGDAHPRAGVPRPAPAPLAEPAAKPLVPRAVDPARSAADLRLGPESSRAVVELIAPDPDAPAGPPPAFDASPLERERERALSDPAGPAPRLLADLRAVRSPLPPGNLDIVA